MISLKRLFTPVQSIDADQARAYAESHTEGAYTFLDVRQPGEYSAGHIPGAKLMPLPELGDGRKQLDPAKPVIVYCAVGGRSRAAAQLLAGAGFKEVYNLKGGIKAWNGWQASGPVALNLELVRGDESPEEIVALAYGMEMGLEIFYRQALDRAADKGLIELLSKLADIEIRHKVMLLDMLAQIAPPAKDMPSYDARVQTDILEGGYRIQPFFEKNTAYMTRAEDVLSLAMMLESQALDLYLRFADRSTAAASREVLFKLAEEEKMHLGRLADFMDAKVST